MKSFTASTLFLVYLFTATTLAAPLANILPPPERDATLQWYNPQEIDSLANPPPPPTLASKDNVRNILPPSETNVEALAATPTMKSLQTGKLSLLDILSLLAPQPTAEAVVAMDPSRTEVAEAAESTGLLESQIRAILELILAEGGGAASATK